jgi:hypothetical protein
LNGVKSYMMYGEFLTFVKLNWKDLVKLFML